MKKMPIEYIDKAIQLLYEKIDKLCGADSIFITDSTGISTDRYKVVIRALKKTKECVYLKMHLLVKYFFKGFIAILSAKVTDGDRNDSPILREHLKKGICKSGTLLADMGYDSVKLLAYSLDIIPMIKQRKSCKQNWLRSKVTADFNKDYNRYNRRCFWRN